MRNLYKILFLIVLVATSFNTYSQDSKIVFADAVTVRDTTYKLVLNHENTFNRPYLNKDYRYDVYVEFLSLTGILDGTVGVKKIIRPLTIPQYICQDTTLGGNCNKLINATPYFFNIEDLNVFADTLYIEILEEGITGGTMSIIVMKNWNRD